MTISDLQHLRHGQCARDGSLIIRKVGECGMEIVGYVNGDQGDRVIGEMIELYNRQHEAGQPQAEQRP